MSTYLYDHARPGMVVGLDSVGGDFVLPAQRPRRILFVSGGSGITPVMSMLRTLRAEGSDREVAFIHYARTRDEACYADELAAMAGVRVLHGYTRGRQRRSHRLLRRRAPGRRNARARAPSTCAVRLRSSTRCGALPECASRRASSHLCSPRSRRDPPAAVSTFIDTDVDVEDDGRPILEQAESAGLTSG